jgi:release factor glutamine methyltransferase
MKISELLSGNPETRVDRRLLLESVVGHPHEWIAANPEYVLHEIEADVYQALLARRMAGTPVAYLLGWREFFGLEFSVNPAVLIPRPETELLVEWALELTPVDESPNILDLGTGSGAIAISVQWKRPRAHIFAVDNSPTALAVAQGNAERLLEGRPGGGGNLPKFYQGHWFEPLGNQRVHLMLSNPPYVAANDPHLELGDVRFEPPGALIGGADGLDALRAIISAAPRHLLAGGTLLVEHGFDQAQACQTLFAEAGFEQITTRADLAGQPRVTGGRLVLTRLN